MPRNKWLRYCRFEYPSHVVVLFLVLCALATIGVSLQLVGKIGAQTITVPEGVAPKVLSVPTAPISDPLGALNAISTRPWQSVENSRDPAAIEWVNGATPMSALGGKATEVKLGSLDKIGLATLRYLPGNFSQGDVRKDLLQCSKRTKKRPSLCIISYNQSIGKLSVLDTHLHLVFLDQSLVWIRQRFFDIEPPSSLKPTINEENAISRAAENAKAPLEGAKAKLALLPPSVFAGQRSVLNLMRVPARLVWEIDLAPVRDRPWDPTVIVDAVSGDVIRTKNLAVTGPHGQFQGSLYEGGYVLEESLGGLPPREIPLPNLSLTHGNWQSKTNQNGEYRSEGSGPWLTFRLENDRVRIIDEEGAVMEGQVGVGGDERTNVIVGLDPVYRQLQHGAHLFLFSEYARRFFANRDGERAEAMIRPLSISRLGPESGCEHPAGWANPDGSIVVKIFRPYDCVSSIGIGLVVHEYAHQVTFAANRGNCLIGPLCEGIAQYFGSAYLLSACQRKTLSPAACDLAQRMVSFTSYHRHRHFEEAHRDADFEPHEAGYPIEGALLILHEQSTLGPDATDALVLRAQMQRPGSHEEMLQALLIADNVNPAVMVSPNEGAICNAWRYFELPIEASSRCREVSSVSIPRITLPSHRRNIDRTSNDAHSIWLPVVGNAPFDPSLQITMRPAGRRGPNVQSRRLTNGAFTDEPNYLKSMYVGQLPAGEYDLRVANDIFHHQVRVSVGGSPLPVGLTWPIDGDTITTSNTAPWIKLYGHISPDARPHIIMHPVSNSRLSVTALRREEDNDRTDYIASLNTELFIPGIYTIEFNFEGVHQSILVTLTGDIGLRIIE